MLKYSLLIVLLGISVMAQTTTNCGQPPANTDFKKCCLRPSFTPDDLRAKCAEFKSPNDGPMSFCLAECYMNETQLLNNGELVEDRIKPFLSQLNDNPPLMSIIENSLKKCGTLAKGQMTDKKPSTPTDSECNPLAGLILRCALAEIFVNCPENYWQNNGECNSARDFVKNCVISN